MWAFNIAGARYRQCACTYLCKRVDEKGPVEEANHNDAAIMTERDGARGTRQLAKGHQAMRLQVPNACCLVVTCGYDKRL